MDKRTLLLIAGFSLFFLLWMWGVQFIQDRMGWTARPEIQDEVVDEPADLPGDDNTVTTRPTTRTADASDNDVAPPVAVESVDATGRLVVANAGAAQTVVLGSDAEADPNYAMQLTLSARGAGIDRALLNGYAAEVNEPDRYVFERPQSNSPDATRPLATRSITIGEDTVDLNGVPWRVTESSERVAAFSIDLARDGEIVATVEKSFRLFGRDEEVNGVTEHSGYEVLVKQTIRNRSGEPIEVSYTLQATTTPPPEGEGSYDIRNVLLGYAGSNGVDYEAVPVHSFDEDEPSQTYEQSERALFWFGTGTTYFNAIVRPLDTRNVGDEIEPSTRIASVVAESTDAAEPIEDRHVALRVTTTPVAIAPGKSDVWQLAVFLGPKLRSVIENDYYRSAGIAFNQTTRSPFGCTWCVFQPVVDVLVALLSFFYLIFRDWGLAIIGLVVLVRTLLHPITRRSQKNLLGMSKLAPKIEQIKKKYGDDKEKMAAAMAEIAPQQFSALLFGCLPMALQTPIWIALYSMLQATFELRHAPLLYGYTWIDDLGVPDRAIQFDGPLTLVPDVIPFIGGLAITGVNLLPLLMAVVFYLQIKLQPQPTTAMSEEQRRQQKFIQVMMVALFPIFLYTAPSGLNLYILTSTTIGIIETKIVRRNLKREEEALAAADEEAKRLGKPLPSEQQEQTGFAKKMAGFQKRMAARMEEVQKLQEQQQKGGGNRKGGKKR